MPLSAWMSGAEPAALQVQRETKPGLILEAGQLDRYSLVRFTTDKTRQEGEGFAARKQESQGLHFLAIQTDLQAQAFAGFWLLKDLPI
jgi:hypothetical protein